MVDKITLQGLEEGIRIETECRTRMESICSRLAKIRANITKICELSRENTEVWNSIRDYPEVVEKEAPTEMLAPFEILAGRASAFFADKMTLDRNEMIAPYDRNIRDLTELKTIFEAQRKIDELDEQLANTEALRRKPLYREMKRVCQSVVTNSMSIRFNHFRSPNVDTTLCEEVYAAVCALVEHAKGRIRELKKVC